MFQFKQFAIQHDRCAMKVGTDGVIIGSWVEVQRAERVLDVGTGSGLIALMVAQRNREALVTGIEIDPAAAAQATENVGRCDFAAERVHIVEGSYTEYPFEGLFDLIVSNPPFFNNSLHPSKQQRAMARHDDSLPLETLIARSASLLTTEGRLAMIIPTTEEERMRTALGENKLTIKRITRVKGTPNAAAKRVLIEATHGAVSTTEESLLVIERERHCYTEEYKRLTREFYLDKE